MRTVLIAALAAIALAGCAYNDPNMWMGRLPPDVIARIEPPLEDPNPDAHHLHSSSGMVSWSGGNASYTTFGR